MSRLRRHRPGPGETETKAARAGWSLVAASALGTIAGWSGLRLPVELEARAHAAVGLAATVLCLVGCLAMLGDRDDRRLIPSRAVVMVGTGLSVSTLLVVSHR
ncbi:MAG: hypothetical protein QOG64_266 [Acidimicrobiaceae bacterium]|nr:hypothetical protein [Acidimicrobiaceae bacterium]